MVTASLSPNGSRPAAIRNPAYLRLETPRTKAIAQTAPLLETLWLSAVLVAVTGVLPLVMFLRG
jgi:hypothetical protein